MVNCLTMTIINCIAWILFLQNTFQTLANVNQDLITRSYQKTYSLAWLFYCVNIPPAKLTGNHWQRNTNTNPTWEVSQMNLNWPWFSCKAGFYQLVTIVRGFLYCTIYEKRNNDNNSNNDNIESICIWSKYDPLIIIITYMDITSVIDNYSFLSYLLYHSNSLLYTEPPCINKL